MGLEFPYGVRVTTNHPIDEDRYIAADITARDKVLTDGRGFAGLQVFVESESTLYMLTDTGGTWLDMTPSILGALSMAPNSFTLKEVPYSLSDTSLGDIRIDMFRNSVEYQNISISVRNNLNEEVANIITNSYGVASCSLIDSTYSLVIGLPPGLVIDSYINNTNNDVLGYTIYGVNNTLTGVATVVINITEESVPFFDEMLINNGDAIASDPNLIVTLNYSGAPTEYLLSKNPGFIGATWLSVTGNTQELVSFYNEYISDTKLYLYVKLRNSKGESSVKTDTISLRNCIIRNDSINTYSKMSDAINAIISDYSGNLTQNVTVSVIGVTSNMIINSPYDVEISDFNLTSNFILTIDGNNKFTYDCDSLGAIKVKNSKNIIFEKLNFINVGNDVNYSVPEELAAIMVQGSVDAKCDNIIISECSIDGYNADLYGSYGIILNYVKNVSIIGCMVTNFNTTSVFLKNVNSINLVKNNISGVQTTGVANQPCLVSIINSDYMNITDNILNGNIISGRRFDTGFIIDGPIINFERNTVHGIKGEAIRITSTNPGKYINIKSNVFYDVILQPPFSYVKYIILISSSFRDLNVINNSVEMNGVGLTGYYEMFIKVYNSTIVNFKSHNNIFNLNFPSIFNNNINRATIYYIEYLENFESSNNYYIDYTLNGTKMISNVIINTNSDSPLYLNNLDDLTVMNAAGYEIDSSVLDYTQTIFSSGLIPNLTYSTIMVANTTENHTYDILYKIKNSIDSAGAYFYDGTTINELTDTVTTYTIEDLVSGTLYNYTDDVTLCSTDSFILKLDNINRLLISWVNIDSTEFNLFSIGKNTINTIYSKLDIDGLYDGDSIYDVKVTTGIGNETTYTERITAIQPRTVDNSVPPIYFPESSDTITLTNVSIESDTNDDAESITRTVNVQVSYIGVPAEYKISELYDVSDVSWTSITNPIPFTLSARDGLKTIYVQLRNVDNYESGIMSDTITLNEISTYLINVGKTGEWYAEINTDDIDGINWVHNGKYWNNLTTSSLTEAPTGTTTGLMRTTVGVVSDSIRATITSPFLGYDSNGGIDGNPDVLGAIYPPKSILHSFRVASPNIGRIELSGLNNFKTYTIKCFGSRSYIDTYKTSVTINSVDTQPMVVFNNISNTLDFLNVNPIENIITIDIVAFNIGITFGVINVLEIIEI